MLSNLFPRQSRFLRHFYSVLLVHFYSLALIMKQLSLHKTFALQGIVLFSCVCNDFSNVLSMGDC